MGGTGLIRRPPDPAPWILDSPYLYGLLAHIGVPLRPASGMLTKSRAGYAAAAKVNGSAIAATRDPV